MPGNAPTPRLDRRITIQRNDGMRNQHGEFVDLWMEIDTVWASLDDPGAVLQVTSAGASSVERRHYTIRYREDVAGVEVAKLRVVEGPSTARDAYAVIEVRELTSSGRDLHRRRYMVIETARNSTRLGE